MGKFFFTALAHLSLKLENVQTKHDKERNYLSLGTGQDRKLETDWLYVSCENTLISVNIRFCTEVGCVNYGICGNS